MFLHQQDSLFTMIPNSYVPNKSSNFGLCTGRHLTVLSYRMHGVQDLGELVKSPRAGGRVLPLASDDPVKFLNVIHSKFIKELLVLQAIHWNWMEQGEETVRVAQKAQRKSLSNRKAEEMVNAGLLGKICPLSDQPWDRC